MYGVSIRDPCARLVALHMGDPKGLDLPDAPLHMRLRESTQHSEVAQIIDAIQRELEGGQAYAERAARHQIGLLAIWLERQRSFRGR